MTVGSNQVSVGTAATLLASVPASTGYPGQVGTVELLADATVDVFLGGSGVTSSTGLKLKAGATTPLLVPMYAGESVYGITAASTATVGVLQT
jgi:hypothetical protein